MGALGREMYLGALCLVAARQAYFYATDKRCGFIGSFAWIFVVIMFLELYIIFKVAPEEFPAAPREAIITWAVCGFVWVFGSFIALRRWKKEGEEEKTPLKFE